MDTWSNIQNYHNKQSIKSFNSIFAKKVSRLVETIQKFGKITSNDTLRQQITEHIFHSPPHQSTHHHL